MNRIFKTSLLVLTLVATIALIAAQPSAQNFSGRGVDMRALQGQAAQCRGPALRLQQRVVVLQESIRDILECNARGEFLRMTPAAWLL